ncbi:MAG TPA: DNA mismatch repair endonuclease MutL, partial [Pseudobdellovibrionaceae bacterium]|nr:DNA mismatch repair endonuclease MutL [Pseudobdellovibrionaceae bacterium]
VIDQIAAGEVVERPSHLVKELVENSLDAGALEVSIEVNLGGREVRVTDNGRGIPPHQIPLALARHATSKLRNSDDLSRLRSFGFRGEALASIAAVSLLKIRSRTEKSELATQIECVFGKTSDAIEVGATRGTQVDVQDLFANVPARLKFLKSEAAECAAIRQSIKALALAHPHVSFHYRENGKIILVYEPAKTKLERARQVLQLKDLYEGFCEGQGIQVHSVFCDPHHPNKTNKNLWVLAQDRWVQDRGVVAAIMEAYRNYLMGGEYPSCVVWVSVDPEEIDVNIHPSKSQVKFLDSSKVFRAVSASIRQVLETAPWNRQQSVDSQGASKQLNQPQIQQQQIAFSDNESRSFAKKYLAANMDFEKRGSQSVHLSNPTVQDFKTAVASRDVFISDLTSEQTNHLNQSQSQSQPEEI